MNFDLNYRSTGNGTPFVFQHGLGSQLEQPQGLLGGLSGIQLISADCPGHGQSSLRIGDTPSFNYYTDSIIGLMDHLQLEKAIWGGISMGAGISLNAALRYPDRVSALVLVRPAWLDAPSPENLRILLDAAELIGMPGGQQQFESQNRDFKNVQEVLPNAARSILGVFAATQRREIPLVLRSMVQDRPFSNIEDVRALVMPSLVIGNGDDPLHPFSFAATLQEYIAGSQMAKVTSRYVDDQSHRQEVNTAVRAFLSGITP